MFKKLDIKMRLLVSFGLVMILALCMAIASISGLNVSRSKLTEFTEGSFLSDIEVKMIRIESSLAALALRDMYISDDHSTYDGLKKEIDSYMESLDQRIKDLKANSYADIDLVEKLEVKLEEWQEIAELTLQAILAGDDELAQDLIVNECSKLLREMKAVSTELDDYTYLQQEEVLEESLSITRITNFVIIAILILTIALGLFISLKLTYSITMPLKELEDATAEMAKGNLKSEITYVSEDAVGRLADSTRKSMSTIQEYINDIDRIMSELSNGNFKVALNKEYIGDFYNINYSIKKFIGSTSFTLAEIRDIADKFVDMSNDMAKDAEILSDGATDQASIIEEFLAQTDTISHSIIDNVNQVNESSDMINDTKQKTEQGIVLMNEMLKAMEDIHESSKSIAEITGVINDIADQTNLLSLNASIEASRAGEFGKGFSVVASEIRELAHRSANAVKEIETIIKTSNKQVESGRTKLADMSVELKDINESVIKTDNMMNSLLHNAELQNTTVQELNSGTNQIATVVDQNVIAARNSADNGNELKEQANNLRQMISYFNID